MIVSVRNNFFDGDFLLVFFFFHFEDFQFVWFYRWDLDLVQYIFCLQANSTGHRWLEHLEHRVFVVQPGMDEQWRSVPYLSANPQLSDQDKFDKIVQQSTNWHPTLLVLGRDDNFWHVSSCLKWVCGRFERFQQTQKNSYSKYRMINTTSQGFFISFILGSDIQASKL